MPSFLTFYKISKFKYSSDLYYLFNNCGISVSILSIFVNDLDKAGIIG